MVPAVKGYCAAFNHVFSLLVVGLAANRIMGRMLRSFEKSCPQQEVKPPEWNLSLVLQNLTCLPYESLKLSSDNHLTWKMCFLLGLMSAKRFSELHGLSF